MALRRENIPEQNKIMNDLHFDLWLLAISMFILSLLPFLVQDGMFLDGVTYAAISKNLANGAGTFWQPQLSKTIYSAFYDHPPLFFGIQSIFFKFLGAGIYTERIFSLLNALLSMAGIILIWNLFFKDSAMAKFSWVAVILWILTPVISWSYRNNMIENTVTVFTLFSCYFILYAIKRENRVWLFPGTVLILLAVLSKGACGLFPLAIVIIYPICFREFLLNKMIVYISIVFFSFLISCFLLFFFIPDAYTNISQYFMHQLLPSLTRPGYQGEFRFYILIRLLLELSPVLFVTFIILFLNRSKNILKEQIQTRNVLFFILVGISASLPIMITLKQHGYYLVPSIPWFIIGITIIIVPYLYVWMRKISDKMERKIRFTIIMLFIFSLIFSFSFIGKSGGATGFIGLLGKTWNQDEEKLQDVYRISKVVPSGTILSVSQDLLTDYVLISYLSRISYLSIDQNMNHGFFLMRKKTQIKDLFPPKQYKIVNLGLTYYNLYKH
jgi:4-amino-4-deoxy-L-arabinose transferase-like glycosyltransferase